MFLELCNSRFSVRSYDTARPVEQEKIDYILSCARMAPSAVNKQPWHIYLVGPDSEVRSKVQACYNRDWFKTAPYYLILTTRHDQSWHRPCDGKDHADIDIAILAEHICLAATEVGIGTCWVCNFDAPLCNETLFPEGGEEPAVFIPLGYAAADCVAPEKKRMEIDQLVTTL